MVADASGLTELDRLLAPASPAEAALLRAAHDLAAMAHAGQRRRQGNPYIEHPVEVALILRDELGVGDPAVVAAALLHDVIEDSELTLADLGDFPERTRELVALLTDPEPEMTAEGRRAHLAEIWRDPDATLLKAADRLSNIRDVARLPDAEIRRRYVLRTRREILGSGLPLSAHPVATPLLRAALEAAAPGFDLGGAEPTLDGAEPGGQG